MAGRYATLSRSLMSSARASTLRTPPATIPRLRPTPPSSSAHRRRMSFAPPRSFGELGCTQSLLPFGAAPRLTAHLSAQARAYCELSYGTFCRTCEDG